MEASSHSSRDVSTGPRPWIRYTLIASLIEKVLQHIVVTLAFIFDWGGISATVVVNSSVLALLGFVAALLFAVSVWAVAARRVWAASLAIALALFDIVGEFVAQGTVAITVTVSFSVAMIILLIAILYQRAEGHHVAA